MNRETFTTREVAALLRVHPQTVARRASQLGIGADLGGSAGFRFTGDDIDALFAALRTKPAAPIQRRRRRTA